jgi:hypothetical protein
MKAFDFEHHLISSDARFSRSCTSIRAPHLDEAIAPEAIIEGFAALDPEQLMPVDASHPRRAGRRAHPSQCRTGLR